MVRKAHELVGGRICLDFVNTVSWRGRAASRDNLESYAELARWGARAGAWSRERARAARRFADEHPRKASAVLESARDLREAVYRCAVAWKRGRPPAPSDLARLCTSAPARSELVWRDGELAWSAALESAPLEAVLWPIVWSAADLMTEGERRRLRSCGSAACGWLFYDESRGQRRRWCSMSDCGNRAKARRFYARTAGSSKRT